MAVLARESPLGKSIVQGILLHLGRLEMNQDHIPLSTLQWYPESGPDLVRKMDPLRQDGNIGQAKSG